MEYQDLLDRLNAAEAAWLAGEDAEAEAALVSCLQRPDQESAPSAEGLVTIALARYAAHLDEPHAASELCASLLEAAVPHPLLRTWAMVVAWTVAANGENEQRLSALREEAAKRWDPEVGPRVAVEAATVSLASGWHSEALAWLSLARRAGSPPVLEPLRLRASARLALEQGDVDRAAREIDQALACAREQGWKRLHARLMLEYGVDFARKLGTSPMTWVSQAAPVLIELGTWRDRARLRAALHDHGRRLADRVMGEVATNPLSEIDRAVGSMRMEGLLAIRRLARSGEGTERVWLDMLERTRVLSRRVTVVKAELAELVGEALVERDRTATMVHALSALERIKEPEAYANTGARIAADLLEARRAWLVELRDGGERRLIGSHPPGAPVDEARWGEILQGAGAVSDSYGERPRRKALLGSTMAVSVQAEPFRGALLLDKGVDERRFRQDDRVLATLLGVQLAHGVARMRSAAAVRAAHTRLEATFDAIRDGVVSVDAKGCVLNANAAAARMLRMVDAPLVGACLSGIDRLQPLWNVLSASARLDGTVVQLPHGSVVVTSRTVEGASRGMVVTLVDLGRAEMMAHQITAARPRYAFEDIVGESEGMREALRLARLAADVDATLLITGESGTGKEMFAQAVHTGGPRAHQPFIGINCAALPRDLLEAELFGYERGAFTGAKQAGQAGRLELVGEGTLLLDEIGDMPLDMQAKLLRVLQERIVVRLGGTQEKPVRARVISTTHRNLEEAVARSAFRLDLLFRLRVLHVHIPPLRNRPRDIPVLALHFLRRTAKSLRKQADAVGSAAMQALVAHDWPGNVRELANVMEREVTLLSPDAKSLESLRGPLAGHWPEEEPASVRAWAVSAERAPVSTRSPSSIPASSVRPMADVERDAYLAALEAHGNVVAAAKAIGVSKSQFYAKLKRWREEGLLPPRR